MASGTVYVFVFFYLFPLIGRDKQVILGPEADGLEFLGKSKAARPGGYCSTLFIHLDNGNTMAHVSCTSPDCKLDGLPRHYLTQPPPQAVGLFFDSPIRES